MSGWFIDPYSYSDDFGNIFGRGVYRGHWCRNRSGIITGGKAGRSRGHRSFEKWRRGCHLQQSRLSVSLEAQRSIRIMAVPVPDRSSRIPWSDFMMRFLQQVLHIMIPFINLTRLGMERTAIIKKCPSASWIWPRQGNMPIQRSLWSEDPGAKEMTLPWKNCSWARRKAVWSIQWQRLLIMWSYCLILQIWWRWDF